MKIVPNIIIAAIPALISAVFYIFFNIVDTNAKLDSHRELIEAKIKANRELYGEAILRIDKRLDRIENKLNQVKE